MSYDFLQTKQDLENLQAETAEKLKELARIEKSMKAAEKNLNTVADSVKDKLGNLVDDSYFKLFFKKPYAILPISNKRVLVVVPKFIKNFYVGWLLKEEENYYVYQLDQYSAWLGDVPSDILSMIDVGNSIDVQLVGNEIYFNPEDKAKIRSEFGSKLSTISENSAKIKKGYEFELLVDIIERGTLPFAPKAVLKSDLRESRSNIALRGYQEPAYKEFIKKGAIGLFHPTGAGKSMVSLKILDVIKGEKRIFVPTITLQEQWEYYIETYIPFAKHEIKIVSYQSAWREKDKGPIKLCIYDECQKLPADTFSRLATIPTDYRLGLSASPHREDGREKYIFALTGFPVGLNWQEYMKESGKSYHPVYVHVVDKPSDKIAKVSELVSLKRKTFIFCDSIELGEKISGIFNVPFINADTKDRLQTARDNKLTVCSRVMDLGASIKDLEQIIEVDFLFGSRQQELQRTGRLLHSEAKNLRHDIIFTREEIEKYGKRIWSLQEKGFTVKFITN